MPFTLTDFLSAYFVFGLPSWVLGAGMFLGWSISRHKTKIISNDIPSASKSEFHLECPEPSEKVQNSLSFDEYVQQVQKETVMAWTKTYKQLRDLPCDKKELEDLERISKYLKTMNGTSEITFPKKVGPKFYYKED